jgi:hypothetical protein
MVVQLVAFIAAVICTLLGRWIGVAICASVYALATLVRFIVQRRRAVLRIYEHGIELALGKRVRRWRWDELDSISYGVVATRCSEAR